MNNPPSCFFLSSPHGTNVPKPDITEKAIDSGLSLAIIFVCDNPKPKQKAKDGVYCLDGNQFMNMEISKKKKGYTTVLLEMSLAAAAKVPAAKGHGVNAR